MSPTRCLHYHFKPLCGRYEISGNAVAPSSKAVEIYTLFIFNIYIFSNTATFEDILSLFNFFDKIIK